MYTDKTARNNSNLPVAMVKPFADYRKKDNRSSRKGAATAVRNSIRPFGSLSLNIGLCKTAFTLIELLVVIAIISLLVSILLPSLKQAQELTRRAVCLSNQRAILLGGHLYLSDHDGFFPQSVTWGWEYQFSANSGSTERLGAGLFPDYVDNSRVFYCPSRRDGMFLSQYSNDFYWNYNDSWIGVESLVHYMLYFCSGRYYNTTVPVHPDMNMDSPIPGGNGETYSSRSANVVALSCIGEGIMGGSVIDPSSHGNDFGGLQGYLDGHVTNVIRSDLIYDACPDNSLLRAVSRPYIGQWPTPHPLSRPLD